MMRRAAHFRAALFLPLLLELQLQPQPLAATPQARQQRRRTGAFVALPSTAWALRPPAAWTPARKAGDGADEGAEGPEGLEEWLLGAGNVDVSTTLEKDDTPLQKPIFPIEIEFPIDGVILQLIPALAIGIAGIVGLFALAFTTPPPPGGELSSGLGDGF